MVKEVDRALAINPGGALEKMRKAVCLVLIDQADGEAISLARQAAGLDSLNPGTVLRFAFVLYFAGRFDEAISVSKMVLAQDSTSIDAYSRIGFCYASKKEYNKTLEVWGKMQHLIGNHQLAEIYLKSDFKTAMDAWMKFAYEEKRLVFNREYVVANIFAFFKDRENTLKYLDQAYNNNEDFMEFKRWNEFDFIRKDPAYLILYEKAGFKKYDEYIERTRKK
jgi:tetratricopeptide (TPR) repeat protein